MTTSKLKRRNPHPATWIPRGELHPMAILTEDKVRDIRRQLLAGVARSALAHAHGVTPRTIRAVHERQTWQHI
jgi:hypothetical protein